MRRVLLSSLCLFCFSAHAELTGNLGSTYTHSMDRGRPIYLRPFANLSLQESFETFEVKASIRGFTDITPDYDQDRLEVRELYALKQTDNWTHKIGAQLISLSETFGVQILDVANPRDYTDFIINDLTWSKLPTWAINSIYTEGGYSFQFIFAPYAGKDILPRPGSFFDPSTSGVKFSDDVEERQFIKDSEYGLRMGKLFNSGLDLNFLYYHHFNRTPIFKFTGQEFESDFKEVNSFGSSFSYVYDDIVFRGDTLFTQDDLSQTNLKTASGDRLQFIYGLDYTWKELWTFGYQLQYRELPDLYWNSFFIQYEMNDAWKVDLFSFIGMNNSDAWIQPRLSYRHKSFLVTGQLDLLSGTTSDPGIFTVYRKKDRILTTIEYQF